MVKGHLAGCTLHWYSLVSFLFNRSIQQGCSFLCKISFVILYLHTSIWCDQQWTLVVHHRYPAGEQTMEIQCCYLESSIHNGVVKSSLTLRRGYLGTSKPGGCADAHNYPSPVRTVQRPEDLIYS